MAPSHAHTPHTAPSQHAQAAQAARVLPFTPTPGTDMEALLESEDRPALPACFQPTLRHLGYVGSGQFSVLGATDVTGHWVSRLFDAWAVVDPAGNITQVLPTKDEAGRVALEISLSLVPMADR